MLQNPIDLVGHLVVGETQNAKPKTCENLFSFPAGFYLLTMNIPINFDYPCRTRTGKVNDKAID